MAKSDSSTIPIAVQSAQQPIEAPSDPDGRTPIPLQGPRLADPEQLSHQQPQVVRRHLHDVPLADVLQAPQPRPPPAPRFADVGEASLHELTALLLQALASF